MMNSKAKGNSFERKISNLLSKRFFDHTKLESAFKRNADSGSFFGGTNQSRLSTHDLDHANFGDIICPNAFKFSLECKNYKTTPSFNALLTQNHKEWDLWIDQAKQDSINAKKLMAVIVKYNRVEEFVIIDNELPGVKHLRYKDFFIVTLKDWLSQPTSYFFTD